MNPRRRRTIVFAGVAVAAAAWAMGARTGPAPSPVTREMLCVTDGALNLAPGGGLSVDAPKMRAVLIPRAAPEIQARFTYLGPTHPSLPLKSGRMRRQFGLKLRAEDGCNLVYAMWRFEPKPQVVVSVKSNPTMHASRECTNGGYSNLEAERGAPVEAPEVGRPHVLAARMEGSSLRVRVDGRLVWIGDVGPEAMAADGPVGVRSDNVRLLLDLAAPIAADRPPWPREKCSAGGAEEE